MHGLEVAPTRGDRRGSVHRARHRHRQLHVREHRPARAPDGRRADRGRRRRAGRQHAAVRGAARRPSSRCSGSRSSAVQRFDAGELTLVALDAEDFARAGAEESCSEGIVDHLRSIAATKVAVLIRELTGAGEQGQAQGLAARDRRRRRRLRDRAHPGRRRAPSRGGLLHDTRCGGADRTAAPRVGGRNCTRRPTGRRFPRRPEPAVGGRPRRARRRTGAVASRSGGRWTASC